ncbi:hypothetical protein ACHAWF_000705, partial [Thalassiosira exigua]
MTLKPSKTDSDPDIYLVAELKKTTLSNGVWCWTLSPSTRKLWQQIWFGQECSQSFSMDYDPMTDISPELNPEETSYFQSIIGIMCWMIELGHIDIATEVSLMSSHLAYPHRGHMEAALHDMSYLKGRHIHFGSDAAWTAFYGDVTEDVPPNAPEPRGKEVDIRMLVDSDHAGDKSTRRYRTGYVIFCNIALIDWLSKRQATNIEKPVFGAEFVAMKHRIETACGIHYKLRMIGVPISGPTYSYGDNTSVINNTSKPESVL